MYALYTIYTLHDVRYIHMIARILKIVLCVLLLSTFFTVLPRKTLAQTYNTSSVDSNVPDNTHTRAQIVMIETISAVLCQLTGVDPLDPRGACLSINPLTKKIGYVDYPGNTSAVRPAGGLLGFVTVLIGDSLQLPIKTGDYTSYLAQNFGLTKKVYGANAAADKTGAGFQNLTFTLPLWTKARNLTYLIFTILFIIVGVGVMLRIKLDARTAMTIQNQIPKIIITLLLVTFSYAIAGFLVDAMWATTYLGINIIGSNQPCTGRNARANRPDGLVKSATRELLTNPVNYVTEILGDGWCNLSTEGGWGYGPLVKISWEVGNVMGSAASGIILGALGIDTVQTCSGLDCLRSGSVILYGVIRWLVQLIGTLIIVIAIIAQLFRVWFQLIKAYVYVILYTVLSPIWIAIGIIPGVGGFGFRDWLNHMLFALSVYPVTIFLFVTAVAVANMPGINDGDGSKAFFPPLVGNPNIANNIGYVLVISIILITPEVVNMMRSAFKSQPSKYAGTIFAAAGLGAATAGKPISNTWTSLNARDNQGNARGPLAYGKDLVVGKYTVGGTATLRKWGPTKKVMDTWDKSENPIISGARQAFDDRYGRILTKNVKEDDEAMKRYVAEYAARNPGEKVTPSTGQAKRAAAENASDTAGETEADEQITQQLQQLNQTAQQIDQNTARQASATSQQGTSTPPPPVNANITVPGSGSATEPAQSEDDSSDEDKDQTGGSGQSST